MLATPVPFVILMTILAARQEMTAFFCVTGIYCTQMLLWLVLNQILNRMIYDTFSLVMFGIGVGLTVIATIMIVVTQSPWYLLGAVLALAFFIPGVIRFNKLN